MAERIAANVREIPRSGIRDFFELVVGRDDVISLGVGEPDFPTPWHIREAAIFSLEKGMTSYTSNLGLERLRDAISGYVERQFVERYDPHDEILVTVGVSEALDLAFRALLDPGDEVLFHEPCYVSYNPSIALAHGVPVGVPTRARDASALKVENLEAAVTPRTKVLMLNFPTNPTGAIEPPEDLREIAAFAVKHDLIVISDEIYCELIYENPEEHVSIVSFPGMRERTVLLHGFSKAFSMTGFRLGYACAPRDIIDAMMKIHQYAMLCAPITSQIAALEAIRGGNRCVDEMRKSYAQRRRLIVDGFNAIGLPCHTPGGAFYAFPDIRPTGLSSKDFAMRLLDAEDVACVPGDAFGATGEGFLRCCYATDADLIREALVRIRRFTESLG